MSAVKRVLMQGLWLCLAGFLFLCVSVQADATSKDELDELNVGFASLFDPSSYNSENSKEAIDKLRESAEAYEAEHKEESTLFMVDVQVAMNVREEPDENSSKVGLLYKDCGGRILERGDGWTKIQSGDLVGWASNDYLVFGEEAEAMANDVGFPVATINADALRVRKEASPEAGVLGLVASGDELEVVDDEDVVGEGDEDWVCVNFEGEDGYISAQYVDITYHIDCGETLEAIKIREEEERQAKLREKQAAVLATDDEARLLGALIFCEAGCRDSEGMLAVGAVVMNRVRSGAYPNTINGVIFASGQFPPALNGKVADVFHNGVPAACIQAAQRALNGETNVGTATHFRRANGREGILIGGQVFW